MVYVVPLQSELEIAFRIRRTMQMARLMDLFSKRLGNVDNVLKFFTNGNRVHPQDIVEMLGMEDGDVMDCVLTSVSVVLIMVQDQVS